jgi:uncharacterized protein (DUF1697 family)
MASTGMPSPFPFRARQNGSVPTHVALLRGINLGGRNRVAMADLRTVAGELGLDDVSTYIQSGNVLFTAPMEAETAELARTMTAAIAVKLGVTAPVVVVSRSELAQVVADNPFPGEPDPRRVHAVMLTEPPEADLLGKLGAAVTQAAARGARDRVQAAGRTLYLHTPDGYGNSELAQAVIKIVSSPGTGVTGTARNWATITKLLELCGGQGPLPG